ncbi:MAG: hypothetical protein KatS3mg002_1244 [Candidatus Woesearchaeota archaeon]|nr:MAG: hypothetical protein KatS3mg002_1244 [Candidatus Woesearchaeota archaeon]
MFWFKKKEEKENTEEQNDSEGEKSEDQKPAISGNIEVELTKIKSQLEALNEVRKANAEQFTRISEQIGELRGALMDANKAISVIEVASTKAIDLVNSVQPDKLMIEVRKTDGKVEALRANIEANESIMRDIMKELKDMRAQMGFYKGVDQVIKMNNEIKQELIDIKKTEGLIGKHADRVETIFIEVEKKFYDFEKFNEAVKELDRAFKRISADFDKMRVSIEEKADKKELVKLVDKFSDFEKHTTSILKLLDQRGKSVVNDLNNQFMKLKEQLEKKHDIKLEVKGIGEDSLSTDAKKDESKSPQSDASGSKENNAMASNQSGADNASAQVNQSEKKGLFGFFKK